MRPIASWLACIVLLGASFNLWAVTGTSSLTATASVNTNCSVATASVAFSTYDPIVANVTAPLNATGSITVTCVKGSAPVIALGLGNNANGSTRRMTDGASHYLVYELYQPPGTTPGIPCSFPGTTVWGTGTSALSAGAATNKNPRIYYVCGTVAAGQNPSVGTYSDTVVATVTF